LLLADAMDSSNVQAQLEVETFPALSGTHTVVTTARQIR
jgi:hypothetical protein